MKSGSKSLMLAAVLAAIGLAVGGLVLGFANLPEAEARTEMQSEAPAQPRTITVVGEGRIRVDPDIAQINIGIETVGPDVKNTSAEATAAMESMLTALEAQGVAKQDIQTSYFNVWVERPFGPDGQPGGEPIYHVNNNVVVTVRDLDSVGTTLGAAIEAGANTINGVTFNISDRDQLKSEARQTAVEDAKARAEELATLNGAEIGQVLRISEVIEGGPFFENRNFALAEGVGGGGVGPISPGQVEITVQLQVTYALQ